MKKVLKIALLLFGIIILLIIVAGTYIKTALPDTGPAEAVKIERTPERIARGKYLANHVTICMDCHSTRQWNLFAGPMAEKDAGGGGETFNQEMGFPGAFIAPNITPFALGDWTDGEIVRAVTTGVNKKGRALFPLMAYHRFGRMDREDVYSIVAYIRTLEPVRKVIPESKPDFPVSILINTMPQKADFEKRPPVEDTVNYGRYIINAAGCVDCHSQMDKGSIVPGTEFGGGMEFKQPGGIVRSPNITFETKTGIGKWGKADFVNRFKSYADTAYHPASIPKGGLNTPMPWNMYAGMKTADLEAIYAYLKTINPINNDVIRYEPTRTN